MQTPNNQGFSAQPANELHARFHTPLMTYFLRRVRNRTDAEDLTQEVLLRAVRAQDLSRVEHAEAFIFRIAINLLKDRNRNEYRQGRGLVSLEGTGDGELASRLKEDLTPERVLISRDSLADVLRTLEELGERTRDIFILFRLEHMKQREIATLYGIGQSTVEKHVTKAVLHLAKRFGKDMA